MTFDATLASGRTAAESRMTSRAIVRRKTGASTVVDGFKVPTWQVVHTDLPIRIAGARRGSGSSRATEVGATEAQQASREAHVPATTTDIADGDLIEITAGENVGMVLRVVESAWQDQATARRLPVIADVRPKEWA